MKSIYFQGCNWLPAALLWLCYTSPKKQCRFQSIGPPKPSWTINLEININCIILKSVPALEQFPAPLCILQAEGHYWCLLLPHPWAVFSPTVKWLHRYQCPPPASWFVQLQLRGSQLLGVCETTTKWSQLCMFQVPPLPTHRSRKSSEPMQTSGQGSNVCHHARRATKCPLCCQFHPGCMKFSNQIACGMHFHSQAHIFEVSLSSLLN